MKLDGDDLIETVKKKLDIDLVALVAGCSVWPNPTAYRLLAEISPHAAWFPEWRRKNVGENVGDKINGVRIDDNSKANQAIKLAIFGSIKGCTRMHACHVWPKTCYDPRYHTSIANIVLLPAALAGLSDHDKEVAACLRYRAYELYGWHPEEVTAPERPVNYPKAELWAPPLDISDATKGALMRRGARIAAPAQRRQVGHTTTNNSANEALVQRVVTTLSARAGNNFTKVAKRVFKDKHCRSVLVVLTARLNITGNYIFDVYDYQLEQMEVGEGLLAFAFLDRSDFAVLPNPSAVSAFSKLKSYKNTKTAKSYRRVAFSGQLNDSLSTGKTDLDAAIYVSNFDAGKPSLSS